MSEIPKFQKPTDVPFQPTPEERTALTEQYKARTDTALNFAQYWTPELPETKAQEIYERLMDAERRNAAPTLAAAEYDAGVANVDDEMQLLDRTDSRFLLTTEHATAQQREYRAGRRRKGPEYGLAALGVLLHEDTGASHLTMLGRQTGDPNSDPDHPFKDEITRVLSDSRKDSFTSLHGMVAGHVNELDDAHAIDVAIGIGSTPNESTVVMAEKVRAIADELNLRAGINEPFITMEKKDPLTPKLNDDGTVKRIRFGGGGNTTRQHAENVGSADLSALQIEYSSFLRLAIAENTRDYKSRYIGAYLGYTLLRRMVEITL